MTRGLVRHQQSGQFHLDTAHTYTYDAEDRVTSVTGGGSTTNYTYGADGQRVSKQTGADTYYYSYDDDGSVLTRYLSISGGAPTVVNQEVWFAGKHLGTITGVSNQFARDTQDQIGSERLSLDPSGNPYAQMNSLPFGDGLNINGNPLTPLHFTGKERDPESGDGIATNGNDYLGARYYSSNMGRFMSPDWSAKPVSIPYANLNDPQSLNLYSYARNNPLVRIDRDGHCWSWLQGACDFIKSLGNEVRFGVWTPNSTTAEIKSLDRQEAQARQGGQANQSKPQPGLSAEQESMLNRLRRPNFYSASGTMGFFSQSLTYVPSTNNLYYGPGPGYGEGGAITAGWATDPNGFAGGPSGSVCFFGGVGGCGGVSTSGDYAVQAGVGIGGWGASSGYGFDFLQDIESGMYSGTPADPMATAPVSSGLYMENPSVWVPQ